GIPALGIEVRVLDGTSGGHRNAAALLDQQSGVLGRVARDRLIGRPGEETARGSRVGAAKRHPTGGAQVHTAALLHLQARARLGPADYTEHLPAREKATPRAAALPRALRLPP